METTETGQDGTTSLRIQSAPAFVQFVDGRQAKRLCGPQEAGRFGGFSNDTVIELVTVPPR